MRAVHVCSTVSLLQNLYKYHYHQVFVPVSVQEVPPPTCASMTDFGGTARASQANGARDPSFRARRRQSVKHRFSKCIVPVGFE